MSKKQSECNHRHIERDLESHRTADIKHGHLSEVMAYRSLDRNLRAR
jgi:hypothetical protein